MNEQHSNAQTREKRMLRGACMLLAAVMVLCGVLVACKPGIQQLHNALTTAPADALTAQAIGEGIDITLEKAEGERYMLIPGMPMPQQLTVGITADSEPCWAFVTVQEKNGADEYLTWQIAEGWTQLQTAEGEPVDGVYYRERNTRSLASWNVLKDDQVFANPETVTKTVLDGMAQQDESQWPRLTYRAWAINRDGLNDPRDAWNVIQQETWKVNHEEITPDAGFTAALDMVDGLALTAYDVNLLNEVGDPVQPVSAMQVSLPVPQDAEAALVLHVLDSHDKIVSAIEAGEAIALHTADGQATIVEALDATVVGDMATFTTGSFSTYYVVSGHNETLKSWWQDSSGGTTEANTRYNVDRDIYGLDSSDTTTQIFNVEPDTTFYLYVKEGEVTKREITENTSYGAITLSGAVNDPAGILVKVSGTATEGQYLTFKVNDKWTVKVIVKSNVIEETFANENYPVYVGITFDPTKISIANEPRVSGNDTNDWTYITNMTSLTITGSSSSYKQKDVIEPVAGGSKATDYLLASIKNQTFLEGTDDDSVKGLIDTEMNTTDGYPPTVELDNYVHSINWQGIADKLLKDSNISSKIKATDGTSPTMTKYGEVGGYLLQPYVVKLQTSKYVGWHINACFVPVRDANTQWMNFDENLPKGAYIDYLNVPLRKPLKTGSTDATTALMYSVQPGGVDYVAISESEYVTLSDGRKLRFIGWNTQSDGKGCQYPGQGATYTSPSNDGNYWKSSEKHNHQDEKQIAGIKEKNPFLDGNTGTMYAFWSAIAERLELHKIVETDGEVSANDSFTFKLTITSLDGVKLSQDGGDKIVFERYDVATDTLVPNSKDSNTALAVNNTVTISMPATQYAAIFLPTGTQYKIEETSLPANFTLVNAINDIGTVGGKGNDGNIIFTNSYNSTKGFLNLEKKVTGEGADQGQLFTFGVTFDAQTITTGKSNDVKYTLYNGLDEAVYDTADRVTFNEETGIYTVKLKHGERIVFSGLEEGTTYTITETTGENYTATVTTQVGTDAATTQATNRASGSIVEDKFTNVVYTNTYTPAETNGTLTITKAFENCSPEAGESFVFTVTDANDTVVAEVVIYGANSKTLSLPYGTYTVTEDDSWSWRYTAAVDQSQPVTVSSTNNPTVTFTNTKSNPNWLDSSAGVTNTFATVTPPTSTPTPTDSSNNGGGEQQ